MKENTLALSISVLDGVRNSFGRQAHGMRGIGLGITEPTLRESGLWLKHVSFAYQCNGVAAALDCNSIMGR